MHADAERTVELAARVDETDGFGLVVRVVGDRELLGGDPRSSVSPSPSSSTPLRISSSTRPSPSSSKKRCAPGQPKSAR
jgi:hypothetical protein